MKKKKKRKDKNSNRNARSADRWNMVAPFVANADWQDERNPFYVREIERFCSSTMNFHNMPNNK